MIENFSKKPETIKEEPNGKELIYSINNLMTNEINLLVYH